MAIAPLIVAVRTTGANSLRALGQQFTQQRRTVSSVAGAYRAANGLWYRSNGLLVLQRNHLRTNTTMLGHLANGARRAGAAFQAMGRSVATAGSGLGPGMQAAIAAAIAAAPLIAAAIQAALITGIGGAGLAAAIAAAAQDPAVKGAFSGLLDQVKADLKASGKQLVPALVEAAEIFRVAWFRASKSVRDIFGDLSTTIVPLTQGLVEAAQRAGPGLRKAFETAVPVLQELARLLPELGEGVGTFLELIADSDSSLKGLRVLIYAVSGSLIILGATVRGLAEWFGFWSETAEKVYRTLAKIPLLGTAFAILADTLEAINKPADDLNGGMRSLAGGELQVAAAAKNAANETRKLSENLGRLVSDALSASDAAIAWEAAIDAVTESVKENGRQTDISTEKGRENVSAVNDAVRAALAKRDADIAMAGGENASAAAVNAANAKFREQIGQLEAMLLKMGFTRAQVDALLGSYRNLAAAPDINKNITFRYNTFGTPAKDFQVPGAKIGSGNLRFAAGGGSFRRGEWGMVGEQGPELVHWGANARVYSNPDSARMLAGGSTAGPSLRGGSNSVTVPIYTNGSRYLALFIEDLSKAIRNRGGNVQLVLGS